MYKHTNAAITVDGLSMAEKCVLMVVSAKANESGVCWPSYETIAAGGSMGVATAKRAMKSLIKRKLVEIIGKKGRANIYKVTTEEYQSDTLRVKQSDHSRNEKYQSDTLMVSERYSNISMNTPKNKKTESGDFLEPSADSYNDVQELRKAMCKNIEPMTF